jgi:multicomponent Na+:H+ antiporter subunit D
MAVAPVGVRRALVLGVPAAALASWLGLAESTTLGARLAGQDLVLLRVDGWSRLFALVFCLLGALGSLFAFHVRGRGPHVAAWTYAGSALGVVLAGDLLTLFVFWELSAVGSVFLIWQRGTRAAREAGIRYLLVHAFGGAALLGGLLLRGAEAGTLAFGPMPLTPATALILLAFAVNAAIPPLHPWLTDAYPEATVTGAVFLSAFTTKAAVYALLRGFPGTELLVWAGVAMALYGVVFAVLENDIRRLLAYHIVSQVGYMVAAVGIGTPLALAGAAAHAFCHILYKGLLLMGAGSVLEMTGRSRLTELGGLWRQMPWTLACYTVGAFSISGVPLFNGFVSKSLVVAAAEQEHRAVVEWLLILAAVGTFLHTGLKLPWFTFFDEGRGARGADPPPGMRLAMLLASGLCVLLGVAPGLLYGLLPQPVGYEPWTSRHVLTTLQLLLGTAVAFVWLRRQLGGEPTVTLDTDWVYRRGGLLVLAGSRALVEVARAATARTTGELERAWRALLGPVEGGGAFAGPLGPWVAAALVLAAATALLLG